MLEKTGERSSHSSPRHRRDFISGWEMLLMGGSVPYEQARFYLQHYLLRHEAEFTQCIQRARPRYMQRQGRPLQSQILQNFFLHLGPLGSPDSKEEILAVRILLIDWLVRCCCKSPQIMNVFLHLKERGKNLVSVLKAQGKKPRGHFLFLSSSLSLS